VGKHFNPAALVATAVALAWLGYTIASWFLAWNPADAGAYYQAAERLRAGHALYPAINPDAHEVYRYAPWFAYAWIPSTYFPKELVDHLWSLAMLVCSAIAVLPLFRHGTRASIVLGALLGAFLAETAMFGNVQPLIVAILVTTARRPSFPVWLGGAASLKLVPILFILPWLGRGEWRKAAIATGTALLLTAPMLLFDLSSYVTSPGEGLVSLYAVSPTLWFLAAAIAGVAALILSARRSEYAWLAAALLMFLGPPRVATSYLGFIAVAVILSWKDQSSSTKTSPEHRRGVMTAVPGGKASAPAEGPP